MLAIQCVGANHVSALHFTILFKKVRFRDGYEDGYDKSLIFFHLRAVHLEGEEILNLIIFRLKVKSLKVKSTSSRRRGD